MPVKDTMASAHTDKTRQPSVRGANRINFKAVVKFRSGTRRADVQVHDVSIQGVRISVVHSLKVGDRLYIKLPKIESTEAVVAWVKEFELGCKFVQPLHPAVLEMLMGTR